MADNVNNYQYNAQEENNEMSGTIRYYGILIFNRWKLLAFLGILFMLLSYLYSAFFITPVYKASTSAYVYRKVDTPSTSITSELSTGMQLAKDSIYFIKTDKVAQRAVELMKIPDNEKPSAYELNGMIQATAIEDTRVVKITVSSTSQLYVATYANAVAQAAKEVTDEIINKDGKDGKDGVNILNIIDDAKPPVSPSSPNVVKNALIGLILGLGLGVAFILIKEMLNDSFKSPDKIESILGVDVVGTILTFE